nr:YadA-like family protein [Neisseria bergeri]
MNKIFRVIYSQATQSWVAVSELTKAHKKQSSSNAQKNAVNISGSVFKSSVIALGLLSGANTAYAALNQAGTGGANSVAWGANTFANNQDGISIGTNALNGRAAEGAIAIGRNAKNDQKESVAIGVSAKNVGNNSIAIGNMAQTKDGSEAIAIGSNTVAKQQSVVLGNEAAAGSKAISIGYKAKVTAEYGIAQGYEASSSNTDAIALGKKTISSGGGSVALGQESKATGNHDIAVGPLAAATGSDSVAIGYNSKANKYRSVAIANEAVADGDHAVSIGWYAKAIGKESATLGDHAQAHAEHSMAIGSNSNAREENAIALGTQADAAKRNALSLGTFSHAGQDAVAAGYKADAADRSVAIGSESASLNEADIAIGKGARAVGKQGAIAAGLGTRAVGHSSIMIGGSDISEAASQTVNYVEEDHTKVTDVTVDEMINGAKVKRHYKVIGTNTKSGTLAAAYHELTGKTMDTTTLDYSKVTNGHSSISLGIHALSEGNLGTAIGTGARAKSLGSIALGAGAVADRQNAVAIGTGSTTELQGTRQTDVSYNAAGAIVSSDSPDVAYTFKWAGGVDTSAGDVVSFGSAGAERQLKNVAAGRVAEDSTDAINGSQLNSVARKVASGWQVAGDDKTKVSGIGSDDQVNFINGSGTTVSVTAQDVVKETVTENGKQVEKIKTPKGANVKFDVKADDKTITVDTEGKVKAVTGSIEEVTADNKTGTEKVGQVRPVAADKGKLATVDAVASAVNNAAWSITSDTDGGSFATSGHTKTTEKISAGGSVTFKAGNNLIIKQDGTDFTYSLDPILSGLTSAEFKGTGANAPITKLTNAGITVTTPADAAANTPEKTVTLNQDGLNNGGNAIANVAGNLNGAKTGTTAPTTEADKPTTLNNSNAATVGDVLNAGWNLQEKGTAKDFVAAYDTVNFIDGDGTSVFVENTDNKTSKIKYSVNLGDGLEKDAATNKIKVKAADKSLEVTNDGVKVKAADKTLTTDANGLKVNTGNITASSVPTVADADKGKIATVDNVADAIKAAAWKATAAKTNDGENGGTIKEQEIKAGDTVTFEADKNIKIAQDGSKFTFSTKDNVEFKSVKVGEDKDGKKPVNLTTDKATDVSNNDPANKPTTALNVSSDGKPTQITGVGSVLNTNAVPTIPAGTATDAAQQPKLVNLGTAHGQTALDNNILNSAATVRDLANMGWKVSSDKATGAENKSYSDVVRNADEVKFVGKNAAKVSGKTENGVRTITVDVEVPDVKTAKLVSSTDGSVIAPSTDSKLQDALKAAKDELAALPKDATDEQKKEAEKKVKDAETALNNALDDKGVATAKNVADMINNSGFTLKTSATVDGKKDNASTGSEVIKPGKTVEMVAGKNLTVKQDADGKVTYSLNPELISLTSAEFKAAGTNAPTTKLTNSGVTITPATTGKNPVSLTENGLNNGGNAIADVAGNLDGAKTGTTAPTDSAAKPATLTETNAATVGDVLNSGWNIQEKGTAKDFVKTYDTVNFAQGDGTDVSVSVSDDKQTSTVKYSVKAIDKSLEVGADGVKVKTSDGIETTTDGITVKAADKTLTVGKDGVKVNTGAIAAANGGEDQTTNRGKVTVTPKTKADGTTETQAEAETRAASEIATVKNVADAINSAAWIAKVENTDDSVDTPTEDDKGTAVKAGDTLNLKAGKNLKVNRTEKDITFALAKDITVDTANVENTLTIGKDGAKVNIASGANGLTLAGTETAADGSTNNNAPVYLNGIKPTLPDTLAGGTTAHIVGNIDAAAYHRAASVQDVLNAGWNIQGAKQAGGEVENVDFVRTYDTVDFVSGNKATTDVTVTEKEGGKGAVVTITAKNDAGSITTAGGKVVVGTNNQADTDPKAGDKVAKTGDVANAINQSGWKTNATKIDGVAATDTNKTQLINPGDAVNYENGNGTVANVEVTQGKDGNPDTVSVKYDVKADGTTIKVGDDGKVTAVTGETETVTADANGKKKGQLKAKTGDGSKLATVESVANAVNSAKWYAKADNDQTATVSDTGKTNDEGEEMGAGNTLTLTAGKNLRVKREGGKFTFATVETPEFEGLKLVQGGNTVNIAPTANGLSFSRPAATAGGAKQPVTLSGISSGLDKFDATDPKTEGLLNLNKTEAGKTEPAVGDNTAATVGDLRGMGWVLSADKKTDNLAETYNAQVKNAEEVKFVGASGVIVSGKTEGNVRTITVGVDHQLATNNSVKPVEYTKKDGTKVYPKTVTNGGKTETKFYPNADGTGDEVPADDVIVSVNGAKGTTSPTTLSNVKSNLPETRNTADAANPTGKPASKSQSAPTIGTADGNVNANNAATVGDVLNSGWNLKGNGSAVDFVRAYDTVNFVNGKGTTVSIETDGAESRVKVDVDTADLTASNGKIGAPDLKTLENAVKAAKADADANPADEAKKTALAKAEADLAKEQNKGVTAQNVAKAINESGFTLKTSATVEGKKDNASTGDELINPGKTVEMVAGKNLTVKQDAGGKVTYATKDDVEFATVKIGKDEDGKKPVSLTTEKAVNANNNETGKEPATALKISSDGKPAQLVGVASVLNTSEVSTKPNGDKKADGTSTESKTEKLIDLAGTDAAPVNKNAAATVGDLQSMGWVVSTKDGNGYTDVVKNAGKVDFKGGDGIEVRGSTAADGTRVITVSAKEGKVTNKVEITKNDGSKVDAVIIDGKYYERDENGKPKTDTEIPAADIKAADNGGSGFVTGNTVANAINDSGWNVGLADGKKAEAAFAGGGKALSDSALEKVNPDDNLRFADGKNTKVKAATVDEINKDGRKITNTYVKFDVDLPISQIENVSRDAEGNAVKKVGDKWYPADQVNADGTLKDPGNSTALSDEEAEKVATGNVMAIDPENKGDKYKSANQVEKGLTPEQMGELVGKQTAAAEAAKLKIENLLKNQPKDVVDAASEAAVKAAQDEAKAQYLKEKGLDKGTGGTVISNLARGTAPGDAVNVDQLQNSGWNLDSKAVAGSSGKVISGNVSPSKVKMDETVNIDAGNNIEITRNGKNIGIATSMTPQFSSVSLGAGADAPTLSVDDEGALNVGSKDANKPVRITNVAPGVKDGDVASVAQLKGSLQNLNNRIDNVDGNARAGIAQAIATAGLVQAYLPGKSMMAIGGGTYRGEAGYAIGYSSISDGGNWVIKGTASGNSRGHFGASASVGYQW